MARGGGGEKKKKRERSGRSDSEPMDPKTRNIILGSSAVALIAVLFFVTRSSSGGSGAAAGVVERLSASDTDSMRLVFRDGRPWVVQCLPSSKDISSLDRDRFGSDGLLKSLKKASSEQVNTRSGVRYAVMDCSEKLSSSGKTVFERFFVNKLMRPAPVFLSHSSLPIVHPTPSVAADGAKLAKWAAESSEPKVFKINNVNDVKMNCFKSRKTCALVATSEDSKMFSKGVARLAKRWRGIQFALVDPEKVSVADLTLTPSAADVATSKATFALPRDDGAGENESADVSNKSKKEKLGLKTGSVLLLQRKTTKSSDEAAFSVDTKGKGDGGKKHFAVSAWLSGSSLDDPKAVSNDISSFLDAMKSDSSSTVSPAPVSLSHLPAISPLPSALPKKKPARVIDAAANTEKAKRKARRDRIRAEHESKKKNGNGNGNDNDSGRTLDDAEIERRRASQAAEAEVRAREELERRAAEEASVKFADGDAGHVHDDDDDDVEEIEL